MVEQPASIVPSVLGWQMCMGVKSNIHANIPLCRFLLYHIDLFQCTLDVVAWIAVLRSVILDVERWTLLCVLIVSMPFRMVSTVAGFLQPSLVDIGRAVHASTGSACIFPTEEVWPIWELA